MKKNKLEEEKNFINYEVYFRYKNESFYLLLFNTNDSIITF
jgi:hypothetical protein